MRELTPAETRDAIGRLGIESIPLEAFALGSVISSLSYDWHDHSRHQLVYVFEGSLAIEATGRRYLVSPQRAIWIAAGVRHRTTFGFASRRGRQWKTHTASLYFAKELSQAHGASVVKCTALLREMIDYSVRWGPSHKASPISLAFFRAIALLCTEWTDDASQFWLPDSGHRPIQKFLTSIQANLREASEATAATACGMSLRTFRRHFAASTGLTWREYITRARLLYATDRLTQTGETVSEVAWQAGYDSPSAFSHAFLEFTGQTPAQYRRGQTGLGARANVQSSGEQ